MNRLRALAEKGQSVWLDFLSREIIENGHLKRLIDEDGLAGITSNPSIFEKAIGETDFYDDEIKRLVGKGGASRQRDLRANRHRRHRRRRRHAAPALRQDRRAARLRQPRSIALSGDGHRGHDDGGAAAVDRGRAREHFHQGARNEAGNSGDPAAACRRPQHQHHASVLAAGLRGGGRGLICPRSKTVSPQGQPIDRIASVASFFVSRIDTAVDKLLDEAAARAASEAERAEPAKPARQGRDRQRQARLSALAAAAFPARAGSG